METVTQSNTGAGEVELDAVLVTSGRTGAGGLWITIFAAVILAALVLPLPTLRDRLSISLDEGAELWLAYVSHVCEVALILLFGGAVFSKGIEVSIQRACRRLTKKNLDYLSTRQDLKKRLNRMAAFGRGDMTLKSFGTYIVDSWQLTRQLQSPILFTRIILLGVSFAVPKGLFGALAFIFIVTKLTVDIFLMQDLTTS